MSGAGGTPPAGGPDDGVPRVTFVLDDLGTGGTQRAIARIVETLRDHFWFQVVALGTNRSAASWFPWSDVEVVVLALGRWNPFVGGEVSAALDAFSPHVLVAALYKSSLLVPRLARRRGIPVVLADRSRTYDATLRAAYFPLPGLSRAYWVLYRAQLRRARLLVVQSREDAAQYRRLEPTLADRVIAIPNAVESDRFPSSRAERLARRREAHTRWGLPEGVVVHGSVMALRPEKRPRLLAEALQYLAANEYVVLVGDGPESSEIPRHPRLRLPGRVAPPDVPAALAGFDVFALPSIADAYPNAVLEAMAAGLPVVATAIGGCREIVLEGSTGQLLPGDAGPREWADALHALGCDPGRRDAWGLAGRNRVIQEFKMSRFVERWRDTLRAAMTEVAAPP